MLLNLRLTCWALLVVATAVQAQEHASPEILPGAIASNAGRWTFLVRNVAPESVARVLLDVNGRLLECERSADTTATSSLWDVRYAGIAPNAAARVMALSPQLAGEGLVVSRTLSVTAAELPERNDTWGIRWDCVDIVPYPNKLGFPSGDSLCTLEDLEQPESRLRRTLAEAGIRAIVNTNRLTRDDDVLGWENGKYYYAYFDTTHSALAMVAILAESGRFRRVMVATSGGIRLGKFVEGR